jgi:DMSO/TMAO reductase YedYZ molybdopterin-dependent catalytic subunit
VLRLAGPTDAASEVVFWGADSGQVTIRDDSGITSGGLTGTVEPDAGGGLDLTITEHFARSMTLDEAMESENLLCWEMNDVPLPPEHGFPLRLIAPGWYGVANVKWLYRIEVTDRPFRGRFMARDYVTIREQQRDGESVWAFSSVTLARLKSAPAKVVRSGGEHTVVGAAWGAPVAGRGSGRRREVAGGAARAAALARASWLRLALLDLQLGPAVGGGSPGAQPGVRRRGRAAARPRRPGRRQSPDLLGGERLDRAARAYRLSADTSLTFVNTGAAAM